MDFLKKTVSAMVTKYGKVTSGRYEGHAVCLGHDPQKKAAPQVVNALAPKMFEEIIFMQDGEGKARHNIVDDITLASRVAEDDLTLTLHIVWSTGEESTFCMFKEKAADKEQSGLAKGIGMLMKMGGTTKQSDNPAMKAKERYGDYVDFMFSIMLCMDVETVDNFEDFANNVGYIPEAHMEILRKGASWVRSHAES